MDKLTKIKLINRKTRTKELNLPINSNKETNNKLPKKKINARSKPLIIRFL